VAELSRPGAAGVDEGALPDGVVNAITRAVRGLRYGSVEITVHDGAVVQIERKEKIRVGRDQTRSKG
jgi:hypothetical protein